jgi:hypothetical protein
MTRNRPSLICCHPAQGAKASTAAIAAAGIYFNAAKFTNK